MFTAAAVAVALWLALRESRWRKADQAECDTERADRDATQARLVTVELHYSYYDYGELSTIVRIRNGSSLPILDIQIMRMRNEEQAELRWRHNCRGTTTKRRSRATEPQYRSGGAPPVGQNS